MNSSMLILAAFIVTLAITLYGFLVSSGEEAPWISSLILGTGSISFILFLILIVRWLPAYNRRVYRLDDKLQNYKSFQILVALLVLTLAALSLFSQRIWIGGLIVGAYLLYLISKSRKW